MQVCQFKFDQIWTFVTDLYVLTNTMSKYTFLWLTGFMSHMSRAVIAHPHKSPCPKPVSLPGLVYTWPTEQTVFSLCANTVQYISKQKPNIKFKELSLEHQTKCSYEAAEVLKEELILLGSMFLAERLMRRWIPLSCLCHKYEATACSSQSNLK